MKLEKAQIVQRRILEETSLTEVTITSNGKSSQYQVELGDYILERDFSRILTIRAEEEIRTIGCYRNTGVVLA